VLKKIWTILWKTLALFFISSILAVLVFRFLPVPFTPLMLIRCVEQKLDGKPMQLHKTWVPLQNISPYLQLAVVASEDQNFITHYGFDIEAIQKALKRNATHKRIKGASTISQQTAKNVFLWENRNWLRKGLEVYFTVLIELCWNKERIMEVYLNVIEMGDGVYGAEATAQHYFYKPAQALNKNEAAAIAAILPNPRKFKIGSSYIKKRQIWILQQMINLGGSINYKIN